MAKPLTRVVVSLIVLAALLTAASGCGSSGDSASQARDEVEQAARQALTRDDPSFCTAGATPRFLNQVYRDADNPVQECRFSAVLPGEPSARRVAFKSVRVDGDHAEATVAETGGADDGSVIRLELVKDGAHWKFDRLADIQIDRPRSDAATRRDLRAFGVTAREASCTVARVRRYYDTDQLERAILRGESEPFAAAEAICLGRKSLVNVFELIYRKAAPKDLPERVVACISRRITHGASTALLRAMFASPDELENFSERATETAVKACAKDAKAGLIPEPSVS